MKALKYTRKKIKILLLIGYVFFQLTFSFTSICYASTYPKTTNEINSNLDEINTSLQDENTITENIMNENVSEIEDYPQNNNITEEDKLIDSENNFGEISQINENINKYAGKQNENLLKEFDIEAVMKKAVTGKIDFSPRGILNGLFNIFLGEIKQNIFLLAQLIGISVITALLKNLQLSSKGEGASEVAFLICYIVIVSIIVVSFKGVTELVLEVVNGISQFMQATAPILITLLVTGGNITSAGAFQPILALLLSICISLIQSLIIPFVFLTAVLFILNNLSERIDLSRLADLAKNISQWSLGILMTIFTTFLVVQGSLSATVDGVAGKTAKFAAGTFIPVVGKYLADAADTIVGCSLVIKNAAGIGAMLGVIAICTIPLVKIIAISFTFKLAAALTGPIADKRVTAVLSEISGLVTFMFAIVACTSLLFLVCITMIIGASNLSAAIR